jgi:D-alanyl-D-alanine carboxypeptidase/D-alanyl-D-alanine-endopeptidase (penicillin-binding protein 4)
MRQKTILLAVTLAAALVLAHEGHAYTAAEAAHRVDQILAHPKLATAQMSVLVADVATGDIVYKRNAGQSLVPASNAKLCVTAAALLILGPDYCFRTAVYAAGEVAPGGSVSGPLVVAGAADPTADADIYKSIAKELVSRGYRFARGVWTHNALTAEKGDSADASRGLLSQALAAVSFKLATTPQVLATSNASALIMEHLSAPLGRVILTINKHSLNSWADNLWRSLGCLVAGGQQKMPSFLYRFWADRGLPMQGVRFVDGSGLSRDDRATAQFFVGVLRHMAQRPFEWTAFAGSLPVAGEDGTLCKRMKGGCARGRVWAKTGTMHDIATLSGYCTTNSGRLLAFSFIFNNVSGGIESARSLQDLACETLANIDDAPPTALPQPFPLAAQKAR